VPAILTPQRGITRAALTSAGLSLAAVGLYAVAVGTAAGRRLDGEAFLRVSEGRLEPVADTFMHVLDPFTAAAAGIVLVLVAHRRGRRAAVTVAGFLIACNASAWVLEAALGELDPLGGEGLRELGPAFYPSGHATAAVSLALAAYLAAPDAHRTAVAAAGVALSALFGCAVVASGTHTPSDVLGAFLLAGAWAAPAVLIARGDSSPSRGDSSREGADPRVTIAGGELDAPSECHGQ
jgi:membrane-associated phospholipid phosphatase